jgi:hypothetical protein
MQEETEDSNVLEEAQIGVEEALDELQDKISELCNAVTSATAEQVIDAMTMHFMEMTKLFNKIAGL